MLLQNNFAAISTANNIEDEWSIIRHCILEVRKKSIDKNK